MRDVSCKTSMRRRDAPSGSPLAKPVRCESELPWRYRGMGWLWTRFASSGAGRPTWNWWCTICCPFHQVEAVLSDRLDVGFAATITPWHKDLAHRQFAQEGLLLAVPKGHPLTRLKRIRLRDLRNMPFVGFQRWANPAFYDELMQACARGGLSAPRIVQEAADRDTQLGLVQCRIGI